jgi:hypothetical protein
MTPGESLQPISARMRRRDRAHPPGSSTGETPTSVAFEETVMELRPTPPGMRLRATHCRTRYRVGSDAGYPRSHDLMA